MGIKQPRAIQHWWDGDPAERFWMQAAGPDGFGEDLRTPRSDRSDPEQRAYALVGEVRHGDVVFHFDRDREAIVGWSLAVSDAQPASNSEQPGWFVDLEGPRDLKEPVTLESLRDGESEVRAVRDALRAADAFFLAKLPADLVRRLPALAAAAQEATVRRRAGCLARVAKWVVFVVLMVSVLPALWLSLPTSAGLAPEHIPDSLRWIVRGLALLGFALSALGLVTGGSMLATLNRLQRRLMKWFDHRHGAVRFAASMAVIAALVLGLSGAVVASLPPPAPPAGVGPITLVTGIEDYANVLAAEIPKWNAVHPDQQVTLERLPGAFTAQREDMKRALQAKSDRYDILNIGAEWTAQFVKSGWLTELERSRFPLDRYLGGAVASALVDGKLWAMPSMSGAGMLYYRKDILDKEGKKPPRTWDELARMAGELAPKYKLDGYAGQFFDYEGLTVNALEAIWAAGGEVLAEDNGNSVVAVDSPEARTGLRSLVEGFKQGWIPEAAFGYREEEGRQAFQLGKLLFLRNWDYMYNFASQPGEESRVVGRFGVTTLPGPSALGGFNLAISRFARHPKSALEFIKWFTSESEQRDLVREHSLPPALATLYDDPELVRRLPYLPVLKESIDTAKNRPMTPYYDKVSQAIRESTLAALHGEKSSDQAISDLAKTLQEEL